jgi:hypothetical protein
MNVKFTSTYKMSKPLKVSLALSKFKDAHQKGAWKKAMIAVEIHAKNVERVIALGGNV